MDPRLQFELNRVKIALVNHASKAVEADVERAKAFPPIVYHYTSADNAKNILQSGEIWLSDIFKMNDPTELAWGLLPAMEAADGRAEHGSDDAKMLASYVRLSSVVRLHKGHFLSASFSTTGDELTQWVAYGGRTEGVAIGFDRLALVNACKAIVPRPEFPIRWAWVTGNLLTYDDALARDRQRGVVQKYFDAVEVPRKLGMRLAENHPYFRTLQRYITFEVLINSSAFKHMTYQSEQEYRILYSSVGHDEPPNSFIHKASGNRKLGLKCPDAIREIVIGPLGNRALVEDVLKSCQFRHEVPIRLSAIPRQRT